MQFILFLFFFLFYSRGQLNLILNNFYWKKNNLFRFPLFFYLISILLLFFILLFSLIHGESTIVSCASVTIVRIIETILPAKAF